MVKEISPQEVAKRVREGKDVSIIDVREDEEVAQGKVPGARHIPLGELEDRYSEIDKSREHVMVCRSGGRSGRACDFLAGKGFNVRNMTGGMLDWKDEIEKG
ncbi:rhodanese-like domain-containing protein [Pseudalkalibacillus caeni]|uniref:Rhodanese-like domain-containing protein n=1 Tax=Exobacillus caeni TaxID=2574798 RepID=A0A5R9EX58_9BACL|nr:rhodanese-like domain-containing protein [Pseudalkalibacillus caeni]TLS35852.1 rhodanese-like domain-containing protein [Pseudalkalibacillus caeni]